jgi:Rrf2 family transcriptional regulator, nitric oxide-sensitive transcriptional repressor
MFSQTTEYALRATVWLAENLGSPQTTAQISEATKVPLSYLSKVLQALGRANVVRAVRGLHGGFELVNPPEMVSLLDIVNVVDPIRRIKQCPLDLRSHRLQLCPLHKKLDQALEVVETSFASTTLADLLKPECEGRPLCESLHSIAGAIV